MAPSPCPICSRVYCDHPCFERGQTYSQMMGDPPGTHPHRNAYGCLCDECTDPSKPRLGRKEWQQQQRRVAIVVDLLSAQAVTRIESERYSDDESPTELELLTEEGSCIELCVHGRDVELLCNGTITHTEQTDNRLCLWIDGKTKILVLRIDEIAVRITDAVP